MAGPFLLAVGGWIASGKSSVAREIAKSLHAEYVEADAVRDEIMAIGSGQAAHEAAWPQNLAPGATERIYTALFDRARVLLETGRDVVLDGCFASHEQRSAARALAQSAGARFCFAECRADESTLRERLHARSAASGLDPQAWLLLLERIESRWEPASELAPSEHLILDTGGSLGEALGSLGEHLRAGGVCP